MKKIFYALTLCIALSLFATVPAYAAERTPDECYKEALKSVENERTDAYALDFYKHSTWAETKLYQDQAKKITAGITNDYDKAKAIFDWTQEHISYSYDDGKGLDTIDGYVSGTCVTYAATTKHLLQAAGLPTKTIVGSSNNGYEGWAGHEWNEVFVDGRWVYCDSTWGEFDLPITEWGMDHLIGPNIKDQDAEAWDGSLYFYDILNNKVIKEIKNFPLNGLVTSTYGFNIKDLYLDNQSTKHFKLNSMKVDGANHTIIVDVCRGKDPAQAVFYLVDNNGYEISCKGYSESNWYVQLPVGSKLTKPTDPVRKGYTFVGWYNSETGKKWDFAKDKVSADGVTLKSKWKKK